MTAHAPHPRPRHPDPRKLQPVAVRWHAVVHLYRVAASKQVLTDMQMNLTLGLRTLLLLALVTAATLVLVHPGLTGAADPVLSAMLVVGRN